MSNRNRQVTEYKPGEVGRHIPNAHVNTDHIIHVKSERPKITFPLLMLAIAGALFLLAFAGPDIGNVLAYLVIPALGFFPGLMVWERFGKVAGILAGALVVAILAPVYGAAVIANSISIFTSLQAISQGILAMLAAGGFFLGVISLLMRLRR